MELYWTHTKKKTRLVMTTMPINKHYSGHWKAIEIKDDQRLNTLRRDIEILRKKCGQIDMLCGNRSDATLKEDEGDSTRQSWMKTSGLWPMFTGSEKA